MKRVLFYLHFAKIGGAELVAMRYIKGLMQNGYTVDLLIDYDLGAGNTVEYAIPEGVKFEYIKSRFVSSFIYKLRTLGKKYSLFKAVLYLAIFITDYLYYHAKVKNILYKNGYDYTITFFQFLPSYLTNYPEAKHLIWLHGSINNFFDGFTRFFIKSFGKKLNKYDCIVTIANEMRDEFRQFYPSILESKVKVLYNPFPIQDIQDKSLDFRGVSKYEKELIGGDYICTVSRLDESQKDISTLIYAYHDLYAKNNIRDKLYIIGDGPSKALLNKLIVDLNLSTQVLLIGEKTNPLIWMGHSKLFILSSKSEGLPTVVIEAMIVGTMVISSRCKTGPVEILENGLSGGLFDVGDINQLSSLINKSLSNGEYRRSTVRNASRRVLDFDSKLILKKSIKVLRNC
jgi:glycosyltransferase involved in cell wall biosynthesis